MSKDFTATIVEASPRYQDWLNVLGTNNVAIKTPLPHTASAPGVPEAEFYSIDLPTLSEEQRARLIAHLAERFQIPTSEVTDQLDSVGCPILADDVFVTVHNPARWM